MTVNIKPICKCHNTRYCDACPHRCRTKSAPGHAGLNPMIKVNVTGITQVTAS